MCDRDAAGDGDEKGRRSEVHGAEKNRSTEKKRPTICACWLLLIRTEEKGD